MDKIMIAIPPHTIDKNHTYASYEIGGKWMNKGEFLEMAYKMAISESDEKSNRTFDSGYDALIDDKRVSIKSNNATISYITGSSIRTNEEREKLLKRFFSKAIFDELHYAIMAENEDYATVYRLSREEAKEFFRFAVSWRMSGEEAEKGKAVYKLRISFSDKKAQKMLDDFIRTGSMMEPKTGRKPVLTESALERQKEEKERRKQERSKAYNAKGQVKSAYFRKKLQAQLMEGLI